MSGLVVGRRSLEIGWSLIIVSQRRDLLFDKNETHQTSNDDDDNEVEGSNTIFIN